MDVWGNRLSKIDNQLAQNKKIKYRIVVGSDNEISSSQVHPVASVSKALIVGFSAQCPTVCDRMAQIEMDTDRTQRLVLLVSWGLNLTTLQEAALYGLNFVPHCLYDKIPAVTPSFDVVMGIYLQNMIF
jgi:hypothetical protein